MTHLEWIQRQRFAHEAQELGDLSRFGSAPRLMAHLGLVPSEHSSGESKQRGHITRTGKRHVRRVLVEAAWAYRFRASLSREIRERNKGCRAPFETSRGKPKSGFTAATPA